MISVMKNEDSFAISALYYWQTSYELDYFIFATENNFQSESDQ